MAETPLELVIEERQFVGILQTHAEAFLRLTNSLRARRTKIWNSKHFFELTHQTNELESFLDDFGARYNRTFSFLTELVASLRAFAQAGYSLAHMEGRLDSYAVGDVLGAELYGRTVDSSRRASRFIRSAIEAMLEAAVEEASHLGVEITPEEMPETSFMPVVVRQKLPRNVGVEELADEELRIAEVASKFLLAHEMLDRIHPRVVADDAERRLYLAEVCTEEQARVYEATVHNLQSAYDTYIKNTLLESEDTGLPYLRGLTSAALHMLEAVTFLTHFYERHESDVRSEAAEVRIAGIVDRALVQDVILNDLIVAAHAIIRAGQSIAEALLRKYTNAQELVVELGPDVLLHARPAALIVGIVNHYGTPVEMEVRGQRCNAASILELLLAVGSHPDEKRYVFRGDATPLYDIGRLFEFGLAEKGIDSLPAELSYLRTT
jgi:hypothetical protein